MLPEPLSAQPSEAEQRALAALDRFKTDGYGYFHQQETRPQTIGYGLADSPVGLAMWMYEKFRDWDNPRFLAAMEQPSLFVRELRSAFET